MQTRTTSRVRFEPTGDANEAPPRAFALLRETEHQARRSERESWYQDSNYSGPNPQREILAELNRVQLRELLADGVDWLAYISDDE